MANFCMPKQGYRISGDCYFKDQIDSVIRYIMIDPLGHGDKASALSQLAVEEIKNLHMVELSQVLTHLSQHFHQTRGLAMSFAFFDHNKQTIQLAIAGNVNIVLLTRKQVVKFRPSATYIGNMNQTNITIHTHKVASDDKLLMFTDGIKYPRKSHLDMISDMNPRHIVSALANHWDGEDDVGIMCEYLND